MYFVYILRNEEGRHYIGQTNNLEQRLFAHNNSIVKSTKGLGPWHLVISHAVNTRSEAMVLEKLLKKFKNPAKAILYLQDLR